MAASSGATIKDVAREAGVSLGTVSNTFNRPEHVGAETRERVMAAVDRLGYVRHAGAASLRQDRRLATTMGLVVLDVVNPYFTAVARGAEDGANSEGKLVIVCNSDDDTDKESRYLRYLVEQRVLGVMIYPASANLGVLREVRGRDIPVVLMERSARDFCSVSVDSVAGGSAAARHLIELGHKTFAIVSANQKVPQYRERIRGFTNELRAHGLDPDSCVQIVELPEKQGSSNTGRVAAHQLLSKRDLPTAVFCVNDVIALGAMAAFVHAGLSVPRDVAVVGYDDIDQALNGVVPLTTVRQPAKELGLTAARLLLNESLQDPGHIHQQIAFTPELVVRESTSLPRSRSRRAGKATEGRR